MCLQIVAIHKLLDRFGGCFVLGFFGGCLLVWGREVGLVLFGFLSRGKGGAGVPIMQLLL